MLIFCRVFCAWLLYDTRHEPRYLNISNQPSLAGQPLLTQKARKGLVSGVAPACLNGMHITSSNVMSLTINYAYWVRDCAQYASEYRAAVTNASLRLGYRRYWFQMTNMATTDSFCVDFRVDNCLCRCHILCAILSLHYLAHAHVISCHVT